MVDASKLKRKFAQLPNVIEDALTKQIEKEATRLVGSMMAIAPDVQGLKIDWTWGKAPRGSITIGTYGRNEVAEIKVTIYATVISSEYPGGFPAVARWHEFGTAPRYQKKTGRYTGRIAAQPFFYPSFRANKSKIKANLRAALRRAVRKMNA
ncbi:hypothetical protein CEW89_08420 [Celeribacter ethanolicus]|uniref:HK97 gp10 family phage protein n=1 Tax=Celeribacter ethanolicus TaxID=1758178 RepID=A0A291GBR4_9RHOB|nr:hypothetical protein [Celeribacter ethanolicus]ATG47597.1 hypothetical protein CEW89_08420 [Celeribacter ethanolicus]